MQSGYVSRGRELGELRRIDDSLGAGGVMAWWGCATVRLRTRLVQTHQPRVGQPPLAAHRARAAEVITEHWFQFGGLVGGGGGTEEMVVGRILTDQHVVLRARNMRSLRCRGAHSTVAMGREAHACGRGGTGWGGAHLERFAGVCRRGPASIHHAWRTADS